MSIETNTQTSVQEIDLDIDSWLGTPGADSIIVPAGEEKKPEVKNSVFSQNKTDVSFLDEEDEDDDDDTKAKKTPSAEQTAAAVKDILDDFSDDKDEFEDTDPAPAKGGRPKTEKSGLVEFFKKRIESKEMFAFDDFDEEKQTLDEYLGTLERRITKSYGRLT